MQAVKQVVRTTADVARWTEVDDLANLVIPRRTGVLRALNTLDAVVTAYDGFRMLDKNAVGGAVRIGCGVGAMAPGMAGIASEAACGVYCTAEGVLKKDATTAVVGLTQLGVATGSGLAAAGIGGPLGKLLVLGSCGARVAYLMAKGTDSRA